MPAPHFKFGDFYTIIFYRKQYIPQSEEKQSGKTFGEKVGEKLTRNQQSIIQEIIHNPYVSARELSEIVGISSRKIEENIRKLKAQGVLRRIGPAKGGHWEVIKK